HFASPAITPRAPPLKLLRRSPRTTLPHPPHNPHPHHPSSNPRRHPRPKSLDYYYEDDGSSPALDLFVLTAAGSSIVCTLPSVLIPVVFYSQVGSPKSFPLRLHRNRDAGASAVPSGQIYRLHPALTLTCETLATFGVLAQLLLAGLLGFWGFGSSAVLTAAFVIMILPWLLHCYLFVVACRECHFLRKEQIAKSRSLKGGLEGGRAVDGVEAGKPTNAEGLAGWVELRETDTNGSQTDATAPRTGGTGGGLGGVGKGL
ncbi:uncharacterized protein AB675_8844, partial [Cyphellophora attinorum]